MIILFNSVDFTKNNTLNLSLCILNIEPSWTVNEVGKKFVKNEWVEKYKTCIV